MSIRIAVGACAILMTACATIITGTTDVIQLSSNPSGATISITDETGTEIFSGTTPTTATLYKSTGFFNGADYSMKISKSGYDTKTVALNRRLSGWYIGNVIFGGLLGILIIDPATGAMWALDTQPSLSLTRSGLPGVGSGADDAESRLILMELDDIPAEMRDRMIPIDG